LPAIFLAKLWGAAIIAGAGAWALHYVLGRRSPIPAAVVILGLYGALYFGMALLFRLPEAGALFGRARRVMGT
jgi:hypothetical protein